MSTFHRLKPNIGNAVLAKYDYRCSKCNSKKNLCVHHTIKKNIHDKDYNDIENLTVLCRSCHMAHHRATGDIRSAGGRRGNSPEVKCKEDNCENFQHGKGLCKKHYAKKFRKKQGW